MNWLLWSLLAALFAGLTAIFAKVGVAHLNSNLATALRTTVIFIFTWGVAFAVARPFRWPSLDAGRREWLFLLLSGLTTGLSWLCYFRALQLGPVSKVAPIDKLSVVIALTLAWCCFGERLSPREICGATLIAGGACLLAWKA